MSSHRQPIAQNQWQLRIASMIKQEFLVATHLAWDPTNKLINCLVTWEVFGGGLMGNLLTDSANVELSLWPETKYRVQVTCKNKVSASFNLFIIHIPMPAFLLLFLYLPSPPHSFLSLLISLLLFQFHRSNVSIYFITTIGNFLLASFLLLLCPVCFIEFVF